MPAVAATVAASWRHAENSPPWVAYLRGRHTCTGFMADTPLKAIFTMHGHPPAGLGDHRCKNAAHWRFTALTPSPGTVSLPPWASDGVYCWSHLFSRGLHATMGESDRFERWLNSREAGPDAGG
jgi:hypothetical protein